MKSKSMHALPIIATGICLHGTGLLAKYSKVKREDEVEAYEDDGENSETRKNARILVNKSFNLYLKL